MTLIYLTPLQAEYLASASYLPAALRATLVPSAGSRVALDAPTADALQAVLTERLAQVGFDEGYELTDEGEMLDDLIDLLR